MKNKKNTTITITAATIEKAIAAVAEEGYSWYDVNCKSNHGLIRSLHATDFECAITFANKNKYGELDGTWRAAVI